MVNQVQNALIAGGCVPPDDNSVAAYLAPRISRALDAVMRAYRGDIHPDRWKDIETHCWARAIDMLSGADD